LFATAEREVRLADNSSTEKLILIAGIRFKTGRSGNRFGPDLRNLKSKRFENEER